MGYLDIGRVIGGIAAVLTFIGAYIYCIATYGFLFGLGLGWLPSAILAGIVFGAVMLLWGPALLIIGLGLMALLFGR